MGFLYKKIAPTLSITGNESNSLNKNLGQELEPTGKYVGGINVIEDFPWTLTPTSSKARTSAPRIYLREFYQLDTNLNQAFKPYNRGDILQNVQALRNILNTGGSGIVESLRQGITGGIDLAVTLLQIDANVDILYEGLFDHTTSTGFKYTLPFFTPEYFKFNTQWAAVDILDKIIDLQVKTGSFALKGVKLAKTFLGGGSSKSEKGGSTLMDRLYELPRTMRDIEMFNLQSQNPTVGLMDPPKVWKTTAPRSYSFQFPLYNIDVTSAKDNQELIIKNWELCYLLTYQNLVNKRNFFTGIPPVFYEVHIPGVHYTKASYISNLSITNVGNIRKLRLNLNNVPNLEVNVPDAYLISITLNDLLVPSKNLLGAVINSRLQTEISEPR